MLESFCETKTFIISGRMSAVCLKRPLREAIRYKEQRCFLWYEVFSSRYVYRWSSEPTLKSALTCNLNSFLDPTHQRHICFIICLEPTCRFFFKQITHYSSCWPISLSDNRRGILLWKYNSYKVEVFNNVGLHSKASESICAHWIE